MSPECFCWIAGSTTRVANSKQAWLPESDWKPVTPDKCTRPDIALPMGALPAYASAPSVAHYEALFKVVRYVGSTAGRGLTFGVSDKLVDFWCNANFTACQDTQCSTTHWVVVMYGGAVSWASKKQSTAAASAINAKYQDCSV
jgi:hypothetical protein